MLILLLACTPQTDSAAPSDSDVEEVEDTGETATTTTDTAPVVEEFNVVCQGEKSYQEQVDLGFAPPAPVDVVAWAHYPDWWIERDDSQSWVSISIGMDAQGIARLPCDGSQYGDLGGPDGFSFVPDQYVVYVKPL